MRHKSGLVLATFVLCFVMTACGTKEVVADHDNDITSEGKESVVEDKGNVVVDKEIGAEDIALDLMHKANKAYENSATVPDLSDYEKGENGLPIITYDNLKRDPKGYELMGLWRLKKTGDFDYMPEFLINPTSYICEGKEFVFSVDGSEPDFDSIVDGICDFSETFVRYSGSNNRVRCDGVAAIERDKVVDWLNSSDGATRIVNFVSPKLKEWQDSEERAKENVAAPNLSIGLEIDMEAENKIKSLKVSIKSVSRFEEQPTIVFGTVGVNYVPLENKFVRSVEFIWE